MGSASRNLEAFSVREALGSGGPCSMGSCGGIWSDCFCKFEGSCHCHEGVPFEFGPLGSLIARNALVVIVAAQELEGMLMTRKNLGTLGTLGILKRAKGASS